MHKVHPIDEEIKKIESFFAETDIIDYLRAKKHKGGYKIDFSVNTESYVSENKKERVFHFELILEERRGQLFEFKIYTQKGSEIPFHPNFKIIGEHMPKLLSLRRALWVHSSKEEKEPIFFIKTMIDALQYKDESLDVKGKTSNKRAETWFYKKKWEENRAISSSTKTTQSSEKKFAIGEQGTKKIEPRLIAKENKKFEIKSKTDYLLQELSIPKEYFKIDESLNSTCKNLQSDSLLFISEKAKEQIWNHIQWGNMQTSMNEKEQGGILLGQVYNDKERKIQFAFVEQVVAGKSARGNSTYLKMDHTTWSEMLKEADSIIDDQTEDKTQVIGWYHTHPMGLDVFMSSRDKNTQTLFFNQDWHYAIVLNPHKKIWKAFVGEQALECKGYITNKEETESCNAINKDVNIENVKKKDIWEWMIIALSAIVALLIIIYGIYQEKQVQKMNEKPTKVRHIVAKPKDVITNFKDSTKIDEVINEKVDSTVVIIEKDSTSIKK
jgi:proteasome lid subunit RPN8/RPN11